MLPKTFKKRLKNLLLGTVWSFGPENLVRKLRTMGIKDGDVLMVHSGWRSETGFRGQLKDLVNAFIGAVGPKGTLCMMAMPFNGMSAGEYLRKENKFDVRKSVSMVGLPSEIFRRKKGVLRSIHPTHSITAFGNSAEWIVKGHDKCVYPFGKESPFEKILKLNGKILAYDVPFNTVTFEHYLEDRFQHQLPFPLYDDILYFQKCTGFDGTESNLPVKALSKTVNRLRKRNALYNLLKNGRAVTSTTIGRVSLHLLDTNKSVEVLETSGISSCYYQDM